ncbi:amino acid transporter [Ornithinibacillus sp. L9]|uniref:Amino acid transporter n=1 Tax=Ornithinibacillus caprae TaxID=2678566 RepID=A0A6N8FF12_9BACI|nr:LysE/ArgO family amino acid transporter [Ornithinibacillus caprae]MUK88025.1 amino acid transporter [Ornithinibacillus caprae]
MQPLLHGIVLAFGLILPLGVQNVFIFNQGAIHKKFRYALPAILTAGVSDTLLITLAVAGVSLIVLNFTWLQSVMLLFGFCFLIYMGVVMWRSSSEKQVEQAESYSPKRQIIFAASVSLLNPHAIMDTIGVIGTSSIVYEGLDKWIFALACIVVSWMWFFALAVVGKKIGQLDISGRFLTRLNQVSAIIVWVMAIFMGYQFMNLTFF